MRRVETGTERQRAWWLLPFVGTETLAAEYVKANGRKVADLMIRNVITANPDTPFQEIATLHRGVRHSAMGTRGAARARAGVASNLTVFPR